MYLGFIEESVTTPFYVGFITTNYTKDITVLVITIDYIYIYRGCGLWLHLFMYGILNIDNKHALIIEELY